MYDALFPNLPYQVGSTAVPGRIIFATSAHYIWSFETTTLFLSLIASMVLFFPPPFWNGINYLNKVMMAVAGATLTLDLCTPYTMAGWCPMQKSSGILSTSLRMESMAFGYIVCCTTQMRDS